MLINAFGPARRMAWALGVDDLNELNHKLAAALAAVPVVMLTSLQDGLGPTGQASRSPLAEDYWKSRSGRPSC